MVKNWLAALLISFFTVTLGGCLSTGKAVPLFSVPGVSDISGVVLRISEDGTEGILTGNAATSLDRSLIEKYVRNKYNLKSISNRISFN